MQAMWVQSLSGKDSLEKGMATHSSIAWRIQWTEEPGGLQSTGLQRVGHNWATNTFTSSYGHKALSWGEASEQRTSVWTVNCNERLQRLLTPRRRARPSPLWPEGQGGSALKYSLTKEVNKLHKQHLLSSHLSPADLNCHLNKKLNYSIYMSLFRALSSSLLTCAVSLLWLYSMIYYLVDQVCPDLFQNLLDYFGHFFIIQQCFWVSPHISVEKTMPLLLVSWDCQTKHRKLGDWNNCRQLNSKIQELAGPGSLRRL